VGKGEGEIGVTEVAHYDLSTSSWKNASRLDYCVDHRLPMYVQFWAATRTSASRRVATITYARIVRARGFVTLAKASTQDLFDQKTAFGRLALVHVIMMAGDTLVTVSLAGSLFFSVTPDAAKGKVLLYLLLTIAPFAVVSPLLGPLIDRSANGRRLLVAFSAVVRACSVC